MLRKKKKTNKEKGHSPLKKIPVGNLGPLVTIWYNVKEVKFDHLMSRERHMCGVHGHEVERQPCNHKVPGAALTFGASSGVVPRKQNRERLV